MAARGDVQEDIVSLIESDPDKTVSAPPLAVSTVEDCCFWLPVFGDTSDTDDFKNDRSSFIKRYPRIVSGVVMVIQKCVNGTYTDQHTIVDDTYGDFSDFGDFSIGSVNYISIYIDWRLILTAFGEGIYRIKTLETNSLASSPVQNDYSHDYHLQDFTVDRADGTIRLNTTNAGTLGDKDSQRGTFVFPPNFQDGIRIPGRFGLNKSEYEQEYTRYRNGFKQFLQDDQTEKYTLETDRLPEEIHKFLKTDIFQASTLLVTDYNKDNANAHVNTQIIKPDSYDPVYHKTSKLYKVSVEFESAFDNMRKLNC
jgi:hypothetical protein|tara:strand:- start:1188 stop:2117 length:930 start_codon:yes stop_codon:yes gene_type:complete